MKKEFLHVLEVKSSWNLDVVSRNLLSMLKYSNLQIDFEFNAKNSPMRKLHYATDMKAY